MILSLKLLVFFFNRLVYVLNDNKLNFCKSKIINIQQKWQSASQVVHKFDEEDVEYDEM